MARIQTNIFKTAIYIFLSTLVLAVSPWAIQNNRYAHALCLLLIAIGVYFYIVLAVASKNWLDIRAVFHGVWIFTIGLAALKLTEYQEDWLVKTWLCFAAAYAMFQVGANIGIWLGKRYTDKVSQRVSNLKLFGISFKNHPNRLFWICLVTTLIGLACFTGNVIIRGYIPCFSDDPNAYLYFYTKLHIFAVASTIGSGACYYCIKTQPLSLGKKAILWLCILYLTFLFPIMVVSRGTFVTSALSLTVSVFYLNKKKLWVLVCCAIAIVGIYIGTSMLRGYTDAQLNEFFEPSVIVSTQPTTPAETVPVETPPVETPPAETVPVETPPAETVPVETVPEPQQPAFQFQLPAKVAFVYSYLTVSHDNFNEAVQNVTVYSLGLHQIAPFNTLLRSGRINEALATTQYYLVRDHLNTINLIGYFYYDFHEWGVILLTLLWSAVFGIMQAYCEKKTGMVSLLVLGNAMTPVALNFFSAWMSVFSFWLLWGTALLIALALYIHPTAKQKTGKEC